MICNSSDTILELIYLIIIINAIEVQWFEIKLLLLIFFHNTSRKNLLNDDVAGKNIQCLSRLWEIIS